MEDLLITLNLYPNTKRLAPILASLLSGEWIIINWSLCRPDIIYFNGYIPVLYNWWMVFRYIHNIFDVRRPMIARIKPTRKTTTPTPNIMFPVFCWDTADWYSGVEKSWPRAFCCGIAVWAMLLLTGIDFHLAPEVIIGLAGRVAW